MILVGELALWVALLMAAWGATAGFAGAVLGRDDLVRSGRRATYATFAFVLLATLGLWSALLASDFSFRYVASHSSAILPTIYKITALWAGQPGSLLFWALILTCCSGLVSLIGERGTRALMPYISGTLSAVALFVLLVLCVGENPFARVDVVPVDGRGMNPERQHPAMAVQPPALYLGLAAAAIPFAYVIAALIARRFDAVWLRAVRRWSALAWFFLTIGIVAGLWWAYAERGSGGDWVWDPVRNGSLLPWLTSTAFLHSIVVEERQGTFRWWNVALVVTTFLLAILVVASAHPFAESPVGYWLTALLLVGTALTAWLVMARRDDLRGRATLERVVSREASLLLNNLILVVLAFSVLWATLIPLLSEAVRGERLTVGLPFFNVVIVPVGLLLLALAGIGPLIAWGRGSLDSLGRQLVGPVIVGLVALSLLVASGMRDPYPLLAFTLGAFVMTSIVQEVAKGVGARRRMYGEGSLMALTRLVGFHRRRYGGYIVHVGVVLLFAAFAGLAFRREYDVTLKAGESVSVADPFGRRWTFTSDGVYADRVLNRFATGVSLRARPDGGAPRLITSEKRQHFDTRGLPSFEPSTEAGVLVRVRQDVYVVLGRVGSDAGETTQLRIIFNPLAVWLWVGGLVMALGGAIVMWPRAEPRRAAGPGGTPLRHAHATPSEG